MAARRATLAARAPTAPRAARPRGAARIGARVAGRDPGDRFAIVIVARRRRSSRSALVVLGFVCLHELYRMLRPARRSRSRASSASSAWSSPPSYGDQFQIVLVFVASVPGAVRCWRSPRRRARTRRVGDGGRRCSASTGSAWRSPTRCCCATCPHGDGIVDRRAGRRRSSATPAPTSAGARSARRPLAPRISPNKTVEGLVIGIVVGVARRVVRRALPGLAVAAPTRSLIGVGVAAGGARRRPVRVATSSATRHQGHRPAVRRPRRRAGPPRRRAVHRRRRLLRRCRERRLT